MSSNRVHCSDMEELIIDTTIRVNLLQNLETTSPKAGFSKDTSSASGVSCTDNYHQIRSLPRPKSQNKNSNNKKQYQNPSSWLPSPSSLGISPRTPKSTKKSKNSKNSTSRTLLGLNQPLPLDDDNDSKESKSVRSSKRSSKETDRPVAPRNRGLQRDDSTNTVMTFDSVGTHFSESSMSMLDMDKYAFMSHRFPETTKTEKLVFRKLPNNRDIVIETSGGKRIGSIDHFLNGIRRIKDATGKPSAIIQQKKIVGSGFGRDTVSFRVYGNKPSTFGQAPTKKDKIASGCYLWAEIKNTGSLGGKFVMKRYSSQTSTCSDDWYCAKRFGSLFSKDKSKGFTILDSEEKECVKMVSLEKNRNKGIVITPNRDMCLMLAFCAVVDEIVEHLLI